MKYSVLVCLLLAVLQVSAQKTVKYSVGKPKYLTSFIKETITWEKQKKIAADSQAGDKIDIMLSDSLITISCKGLTDKFIVEEVRGDEFGIYSFKVSDTLKVRYITSKQLLQVENELNGGVKIVEDIYYLE